MSAAELIDRVRRIGVHLWVDGESLRFRAPQGVLGADLKAQLSAAKSDVIAELTRETAVLRAPGDRFEPFPLTEVQGAYSLGRTSAFRWGGVGCHGYAEFAVDLTVAAPTAEQYRAAWRSVVDTHEMLRCVVHPDGYQVIDPGLDNDVLVVHQSRDAVDIAAQRGRIAAQWRNRSYPLGAAPMYDIAVTIGPEDAVVHVSVDLLIADFVSIFTLMTDFGCCLLAPGHRLPTPDLTFREYLLNLAAYRDSADGVRRRQRDLEYWRSRLDELPPPLALPLLPNEQSDAPPTFSRRSMRLGANDFAAFSRHAAGRGGTASVALAAALGVVLGRYGDRDHFLMTMTTMSRHPFTPDVGRIVGDFTGTSLLDVDVRGQPPFGDALRAVGGRLFDDMDHAGVSGVDVARMLARRDEQRGELSPIVLTSTLGFGPRGGSTFLRPVGGRGLSQTPQVLLDCQIFEIDGACEINWDTRDHAVSAEVLDRAFSDFENVVTTLSTDACSWYRPLLPMQAPEPVALSAHPVGPSALLHDGFLRQTALTPDAVAIRRADEHTTYAELLAAARLVAAELSAAGVRPGRYVGIRLPEGRNQVAAMLATVIAGAAYVPLDVTWPDLRVAAVMQQCGPAVVCEPGGPVDALLADPASWLPGAETGPIAATDPDSTAYVIFTSGSTGTPKGVMVSHRAVTNTIDDVNDRLGVGVGDSVLAVSQHTFDLSVYNVFGMLAAGGAIVFADGGARNDPQAWLDAITQNAVTVWNSVPAQMQLLLEHVPSGEMLPTLRQIMLSGDWIPVAQPEQIAALAPGAQMLSLGGATEAAIWSICHPLQARRYVRSIPYGTAMRNQSVHVLTHRGEPAAPWQIGEIHIGGIGLAQGYLGDPQRTAAAFVEHPISGERLYRTGDYGRLTPAGVVELLGRRDNRVKIRGHRIELAEVESALSALPGVQAAIAVTVGAAPHDLALAAAVVAQPATDHQCGERRRAADAVQCSMATAHRDQICNLDAERVMRFGVAARDAALTAMTAALGTVASPGEHLTVEQWAHRLSIPERGDRLLRRWIDALVDEGLLTRSPVGTLQLVQRHSLSDSMTQWRRVRELGTAIDYGDDLLAYVGECIRNLPGLLDGTVDPLGLLFPEGEVDTATAAYRDNLVSRYVNALVVSGVVARAERATPQRPLRVLEVGAGVGGTTMGLVAALRDNHVRYTFTDVSNFFLVRARNMFTDHDFLDYRMFDVNRPPAEQGLAPADYDVIVCANVLHNAVNIDDALVTLDRLLSPGGALVFVDSTAVNYPLMISMEFKEGLRGFTDERAGTHSAFLSHAQWQSALARSALSVAHSYPPPEHPLSLLGQHVFWCESASNAGSLRPDVLTVQARQILPDNMIPRQIIVVPTLPLTGNGKFDRVAVTTELEALRSAGRAAGHGRSAQPGSLNAMQARIAEIWVSVLGLPSAESLSSTADFFTLGGDSLLMAQAIGRIRREIVEAAGRPWDDLLRAMVSDPTLAGAAAAVCGTAPTEAVDAAAAPSPLVYLGVGEGMCVGAEIAVCVHDGSGGLGPYDELLPHLRAAGVPELYGLRRVPGDGYLQIEPAALFTTLAVGYSAAVAALRPTKVHLLGYCMGGLLAAEIAKCLEECGIEVASVTVVSSYRPPMDVQDDDVLDYCFAQILQVPTGALGLHVDDAAVRGAFARARQRHGDVIPAGALRGTAEPELAACLERSAPPGEPRLTLLAQSGVLGDAWDAATLAELRSVFVHSLHAVVHGAAEPFLGDIHFLRQRGDIHFLPTLQEDMTAFWSQYCLGTLTISGVDGNHFDCLTGDNAQSVASLLVDSWAAG